MRFIFIIYLLNKIYMSKYIFYHIYCNDNTYSIVSDQITKILFSGLYDEIDCIYCFLTGEENYIDQMIDYLLTCGKKFIIEKIGINDQSFERFTIHKIKNYILPDDKFLYIHSKGVSYKDCKYVYDWRTFMEYYLMNKHKKCIELLDIYDTVGVNLSHNPFMHYAGNFWWCRGSYFLTLPDIKTLMIDSENQNKQKPHDVHDPTKFKYTENYLCMNNPNAYCMNTTSGLYHYTVRYPLNKYVDL